MATVRKHLAAFHERAAADHTTMAKCFSKLAGYSKAAKSEMKDGEPMMGLGECLTTIANTHEAAAAFHKEAMSECMKAAEADMNKLVPSSVSMIAPETNSGVRAVLRAGQQPITAKPDVPVQFEKFISVEE
jgi:hypothetical protein